MYWLHILRKILKLSSYFFSLMTNAIWAAQLIKDIFVQSSPNSITEAHKTHRLKVSDVNYHAEKHLKWTLFHLQAYYHYFSFCTFDKRSRLAYKSTWIKTEVHRSDFGNTIVCMQYLKSLKMVSWQWLTELLWGWMF